MRSRICGEALAHRPEAQAPACPGRRRVEPPIRAAEHRLTWARAVMPARRRAFKRGTF